MVPPEQSSNIRLVISCPDKIGIVADVCQYIAKQGGSMVESSQHTDATENWFYMRNEINTEHMTTDIAEFNKKFEPIAKKFKMKWYVRATSDKRNLVLMASHSSYCLADLLHRWHSGELHCNIPCVISNHENLRSMVEWHGIPFHYVPVPKVDKREAFKNFRPIKRYFYFKICIKSLAFQRFFF